jgi:tetratricopeptide (TPR) repeat protein
MTAGIVVSTILLFVQGTRCLIRQGAPPFVRRFGALTLLLAALSGVLFVLLHFGEAVLSPEFDAVMARGHRRGLAALVLGMAVAAGLGLHVQRLKAQRPGRLAALLLFGAAVGVLATMRITTLNPDETEAFRIYAYDLWWPPLLVWVSACFLDGALVILGLHDHRVRMGAFAILLLGLARASWRRASFGDPTSERLWDWVFWVGVALAIALLIRLVRAAPGGARGAAVWLAAAPGRLRALTARAWREIVIDGWDDELMLVRERVTLAYGRLLGLLAIVTIAGILIDIFYIGRLSNVTALIVLAAAWTCLAEVTAEGPLRAFVLNTVPAAYEALASQQSRLGAVWSTLRAWLAVPLQTLRGAATRFLSLRPLPEGILKVAFLLVLVVVLFEIPNRGKTLLQPFKAAVVKPKAGEVPGVEQQAAIGQAVFDHLVNTLGALTQDLQPDAILLLQPDPLRGAQFRTIAAGGAGSIDPFLSGTSDLDLGVGVKVPLGFILTPIVKPVRWLLGVRIIEGSVLADPQGYTVLVRSSSGEVWQARLRPTEQAADSLAPASAFRNLALELAFRIMSVEPALASVSMTRSWEAFEKFRAGLEAWQTFAVRSGEQDPDALTAAIRGFRAAIAVDPTFALAHYRLGLALEKDRQSLAAAEALRNSLKANPGFVPARVALASVLYGLASRAVVLSLHPSGWADTTLQPAKTSPAAGGASPGRAAAAGLYTPMLEEARTLWQSVLSPTESASLLDRAASWAGLCRYAFERGAREQALDAGRVSARWIWPTGAGPRLLHAAYFHCQQADRFYAALLGARGEDVRLRTARASVLASIGLLLERHGPPGSRYDVDRWQCSADAVVPASLQPGVPVTRSVVVGRFTRPALRYYWRAVALLPEDTILRCREATATLALDPRYQDDRLMRALENVSAAHVNLADSYFDLGTRYLERARSGQAGPAASGAAPEPEPGQIAAGFFQLALDEYREALRRDPTSSAALNQFARVFWEWRQAAADKTVPREPGLALAREAEWYARRAVAMVEAKLDGASSGLILSRSAGAPAPLTAAVPHNLRPPAAAALASLGSVLLGQSRAHEAAIVLESAQAVAPEHPAFDRVRWMLGQALLCAASRQWQADLPWAVRRADERWRETYRAQLDAIQSLRQAAAVALDQVRDNERAREDRPFEGRTDIGGALSVCRTDWLAATSEQEGQIRYVLKQVQGQGRSYLCGRLGVRAPKLSDVGPPPQASDGDIYLRVWGGGAERLRLDPRGEGERGSDVIALPPITSRFYYLAQLETEDGRPLSPPLALDPNATPARAPSASAARCTDARTLITLTAERAEDAAAARASLAQPEEAVPKPRRGDKPPGAGERRR